MSFKSIAQSTLAATALAVATFAGTSMVGSSEAEARGLHRHRHHHHHHRFHRHFYVAPFVAAGVYGGGCYWLKVKAVETGSGYWWNRYYNCRGY